ncbi:protein ALP1-like [Selaginella moellendorffii]|uniref:protein ALP1-like n=1 Tax=Selaginella moellendorffii TaxID=88036 RepID=UPI000D1CD2BB|nr:protein ALP1-like [Selaginella moellendorffii]|eukprot:XP_024539288.1 protein ALP1-like [Selaginella moellendorffii]
MADWEEESCIFDGVHPKMDRRKKLRLAVATACSAASAVEQIINVSPASFGLETGLARDQDEEKRQEEEDDELNALFFQSAMLSASLALSTDAGWWVKPRNPAWFDKFLLEVHDRDSWFNALKMSRETFLWICDQLKPLLNKKVTTFRSPIPVPCRLGAALYRLTSGADLHVIGEKFGIGVSSSQSCVIDVVRAINQHFGSCVRFPERLRQTAAGFVDKCELPNCVGAIGTTNVQVMASGDVPSCLIALQAVCDTSYRFLDIQCNAQHPHSPGLLKTGANLLSAAQSENSSVHYLVGGDKYPLLPWLLVRYQEAETPVMAESFNRRHVRAVIHIEQSFGILKETFEILAKCVKHNVKFVPKVIAACCILHNVLLDKNEIPVESILQTLRLDEDSLVRYHQQHHHLQAGNGECASLEEQQGQELRDQLAEMFFRKDL